MLSPSPTAAQAPGCAAELSSRTGAQIVGQVFERNAAGQLVPLGERQTELQLRSGQFLRLYVRPVEGELRPTEPDCQVRVNTGRLSGVARLLTTEGFVFSGGTVYGQFRPGEERVLEFEMRPYEEWSSPTEQIELEDLVTISLPETPEFVARLPVPPSPPPGAVCADVVYADAAPAEGVVLGLSIPPDGPTHRRPVGADGRVCWEGLGETVFGDLSLEGAEPALGQPRSRYVSREANYRLFVVKRPK